MITNNSNSMFVNTNIYIYIYLIGKSKSGKAMTQFDLNKTVFEIHKISEKLSDFHALMNSLSSYIDWSDTEKTKKIVIALLYSYPIWIILNYLVSFSWT